MTKFEMELAKAVMTLDYDEFGHVAYQVISSALKVAEGVEEGIKEAVQIGNSRYDNWTGKEAVAIYAEDIEYGEGDYAYIPLRRILGNWDYEELKKYNLMGETLRIAAGMVDEWLNDQVLDLSQEREVEVDEDQVDQF